MYFASVKATFWRTLATQRNRTLTADSRLGSQYLLVIRQTLDSHNLPIPKITAILAPTRTEPLHLNPCRITDEHPHQHIRKHIRMEHDSERLVSIRILEYDWYEGSAQRGLFLANHQTHTMSAGIQFRAVLLWDGFVEFLADEVAGATSNAYCEAAVSRRMMVFKVGDEGWGVAEACDVRVYVPDAAVSLIVKSRKGVSVGRQLGA